MSYHNDDIQEAVPVLDFPFSLSDPVPKRAATGVINTFVTLAVLAIFVPFWYVYLVRIAERRSIGVVNEAYERTIDDLLAPLPPSEQRKYRSELDIRGTTYADSSITHHNDELEHNLAYGLIGFLVFSALLVFLVAYFVRPKLDADHIVYSSGTVLALLFITDLLFYGVYEYPFETVNQNNVALQTVEMLKHLT